MKKKTIIISGAVICMSCILSLGANILKNWVSDGLLRKVLSVLALIGWVDITYNVITLKYKWIKKLIE